MSSTNNQNTALKKLSVNSETLKSYITEPPVQDLLVAQIGNFFEKFADTLGQCMTTLGNQIYKNIIDAINTPIIQGLIRRKELKNHTNVKKVGHTSKFLSGIY